MLRFFYFLLLSFLLPFSLAAQIENYVYREGDEHQLHELIDIEKEKIEQINHKIRLNLKDPKSEEDYFSLSYRLYKKHLTAEQYKIAEQVLSAAERAKEELVLSQEVKNHIELHSFRLDAFEAKLLPSYLDIQSKLMAQFSAEDIEIVDSMRVLFYDRISEMRERMNLKIKKISGSEAAQKRKIAGMRAVLAEEEKLLSSETLNRFLWPKSNLRAKAEYITEKYAEVFAQYETDLQTLALREVEEILIPSVRKSAQTSGRKIDEELVKDYKKNRPVSLHQKVFLLLVRK